jgi:hypothetical protein
MDRLSQACLPRSGFGRRDLFEILHVFKEEAAVDANDLGFLEAGHQLFPGERESTNVILSQQAFVHSLIVEIVNLPTRWNTGQVVPANLAENAKHISQIIAGPTRERVEGC